MACKAKGIILKKISVIIPAYNCSQFLDDALKSVINQNLEDFEVIVVDDGSNQIESAACWNIIKSYPHTKLLTKCNGGAASARNFGAKSAAGEYLAFLDSDDVWLEGKIQSQLDKIDKDPTIGLMLGNIIVVDEQLNAKYRATKHLPDEKKLAIEHFFLGKIVMNTPTILVRKKIFDSVGGFPEDLIYREDHYFLMKVTQASRIISDDTYLTLRRERPGSLSSVKDVVTEFGKHSPFWTKSSHEFNFLNVNYAKVNLIIKLFVYYLRNNRQEDIKETINYSGTIGAKYRIMFTLLSKMSWMVNLIYKLRSSMHNARI